jgi:hypothetical protein
MLEDRLWTIDPELTKESFRRAYRHPDGRSLLVFREGRGSLFESREELLALHRDLETRKPEHLLKGRLEQPAEFLTNVPTLIGELATKLRIQVEALDRSEASLELVDAAVRKIGRRKCLTAPYFGPLVAYVGEVMRAATQGRWELRSVDDGDIQEPWIIDPAGREYAPFAVVFRELYDSGKAFSIRGAVAGSIRSYLLEGPLRKP